MKKLLLTLLTVVMSVSVWGYTYTKVTSAPVDWSGEYVLVGNGNNNGKTYAFNGQDVANGCTEVTITNGTLSDYSGVVIVVAALQDGGYSVKVKGGTNDGKYISSGSSEPTYANALKFNDAPHRVDFSMNKGNVVMSQTITEGNVVSMRFNYASDQMRFRFYKNGQQPIQLYKKDTSGGVVNVSGVTLNTNTETVSVGNSITLTATIAPTNADNKNISWSTSDDKVATVVDGIVKAKSVGTATITVTTEDGNYSANCVVTVTPELPFAGTLYSWDGSQKSSSSSAGETGGAASVVGDANNKVGAASKLNWCLQLGKGYSSGTNYIKITLDRALKAGDIITTGCFVTGPSRPDADLVYGINFGGENEAALTYDADNESVSQIPYISTNTAPADQDPIIVPAAAQGKKEIWIYRKSGSTTLYVSKFVVTRPVANITVSDAQYATFYNANFDYTMPEGLTGYAFFENTLEKAYTKGDVVPAGEPLVLGGAAGNYTLFAGEASSTSWKEDNMNDLCGAATDMTAAEMVEANPGMGKFYALSLNAAGEASSVGFYWMEENGAAFGLSANKAYLALPADTPARSFAFNDETTGIQSVNTTVTNSVAYNLAGQRVTANAKGLVIMNGKKYINK